MATRVNIPLEKLVVRRDFNSRVALEFYRGDKWSEYLAFDPSGLQKYRETTSKFEANYNKVLDLTVESAALSLIGTLRSAYLPGDGVAEIILEVYTMAATNNNDLTALDTKALLEVHNKLASAAGKPELSSFKSGKGKLIEKIVALQAEVTKPTAKQAANKATSSAKAEKRLEGLKELKESKAKQTAAKPAPKEKAKAESKPADKPKATAAKTNGSAKGPGVGAFCMDLIKSGKTNAEVLAAAKAQFPNNNPSASSVAWYRNKLKSDGEIA